VEHDWFNETQEPGETGSGSGLDDMAAPARGEAGDPETADRVAVEPTARNDLREGLEQASEPSSEPLDDMALPPSDKADAGEGVRDSAEEDVPVAGFEKSPAKSNEWVRDHIEKSIPESHRDGIQELRYVDKDRWDRDGDRELGASQSYENDGLDIEVYSQGEKGTPKDIALTVDHEFGHNAYRHALTAEDRSAWSRFHEKEGELGCVNAYAETSAEEDFCESYAFCLNEPDRLESASPDKHAFMERVLANADLKNVWQRRGA